MKFADLHLHTIFSDGTSTVAQVIKEAEKAGLSAIAITDHDTVEGVRGVSRGGMVEVLTGIELSAEYAGREVHILGYLVDCENARLQAKLDFLKANRTERVYEIIKKLNNLGINLSAEKVFEISGNGIVGRLHIARALVKNGFTVSTYEAFQKYIGDKCPAFVLGFKLSPQEAIGLIKGAGGISVLAHPYSLHSDELIVKLVENGLEGLEVYYPEHSQGMINFYLDFAKKQNLLITGGSDYHGSAKPEVKVGSVKVPYALVEKLKQIKTG